MNTNSGALSFDAYINNTDFKRQLEEMERRIVGLTDSTIKEADKMDAAFKKVGTAKAQLIHLAEIAYNTSFCAHRLANIERLMDNQALNSADIQFRSNGGN